MSENNKMKQLIKCCSNCGKEHYVVPGNAKVETIGFETGVFWECVCTSTMFVPLAILEKKAV